MKVLHLISGGDTGGARTHLISLMKGLDKKIDAKVICFIEDTFFEDLKKEGIDIEVFAQKSRMDMSVVRRLEDEVRDKSYEIIHCHGARANFIGMFLKRRIKDVPMVTTIHSDYKLDFKDNFYKKVIFTSLNTLALKSIKYYIAISDTFKDMLVERGFREDRIYIAYNGIDFSLEPQFESREEFLKKYSIDQNKILVGIVARLDQVKDHETFIKGASLVLKERDDVEFLIAGNGNQEEELKALVGTMGLEDKIHFLGFVDDPYSMFNAIDINSLTSVSESFPYVILEGARMSKTIVSTKVGGLNKLVEDGYNGYLVDVKDYEAFGKKILDLAENKEDIKSFGERLNKKVRENFSSDAMAKTHVAIYEKIINDGK